MNCVDVGWLAACGSGFSAAGAMGAKGFSAPADGSGDRTIWLPVAVIAGVSFSGVNIALNATFISEKFLAGGAAGVEGAGWGVVAGATFTLESPAGGVAAGGADATSVSTGMGARMAGMGTPGAVGPAFRDDSVRLEFAVAGALVGAGTAKSSDAGFAETGTAWGLPNIERIIASAICAGDVAISQGFAVVFAAGATCGAV
ncbi:MAG TPA: hypothetical protein VNU44_04720 [Bryobacteraceae bacterium]|nr:hypothetical protein [Bryobacteraceae bacterium]